METYFVNNMTETVLKAQVSQWWETETMEVESGSHQSQAILFLSTLYFDKSTYCRYSAISGTTTGTSLSLTIAEHTLLNHREDV